MDLGILESIFGLEIKGCLYIHYPLFLEYARSGLLLHLGLRICGLASWIPITSADVAEKIWEGRLGMYLKKKEQLQKDIDDWTSKRWKIH